MTSPFNAIPKSDWIASNDVAFAIFDKFPVSPGHALVIPHREVETFWDATHVEREGIWKLVDEVKRRLDVEFRPDGYNVGFNSGDAAGQTVFHLHVHVIPRYRGDHVDPRGGVRWVLPNKANYWAHPELFEGRDDRLLTALRDCLRNPEFDRIDLIVSFIMRSGLDLIAPALRDAVDRGAQCRILTTDYLEISEAEALEQILDWIDDAPGRVELRVFHDDKTSFHPKSYIFWSSRSRGARAYVGSSNLSRSALTSGIEWNVGTSDAEMARLAFERAWIEPRNRSVTNAWLIEYAVRREASLRKRLEPELVGDGPLPIEPNEVQVLALFELQRSRTSGFRAGLVVLATGLGKTFLSAFDFARTGSKRALFIAHREEILRQSRDAYRKVVPFKSMGFLTGNERSAEADVVFASVQTLSKRLSEFAPDAFDYIVVDEFHHATAPSYRKIIDHFDPRFLLGLTATPDRLDGADLRALCGDNVVFRCDLLDGIRRNLLCTFTYHGVPDTVDFEPIPWRSGRFDPDALTQALESKQRAENILREWRKYKGSRTLAFCCSVTHAEFMRREFTAVGVRAVAVHAGANSSPRRGAIEDLAAGTLDVIFCVDMFNEGLDVPEIDTVLMLRPTQSPIVFLQQLGRGLRRGVAGKVLQVVDFIGNHRTFLTAAKTLLGLSRTSTPTSSDIVSALQSNDFGLPPGCRVDYALTSVEVLSRLARLSHAGQFELWCRQYVEDWDTRPTAVQAYRAGFKLSALRQGDSGWFGALERLGLLDAEEQRAFAAGASFLRALEVESFNASYKLVVLRALLHEDALARGLPWRALAAASQRLVIADPRLVDDVRSRENPDPAKLDESAWAKYWRRWPIAAWLGELNQSEGLFVLDGDMFTLRQSVDPEEATSFSALVSELVDYHMARYFDR